MELFLDTNILVGYVFKTDMLNFQSVYVINSRFDKYSSCNVKRELKNVCKGKVNIAKSDMDEILIKLSRKKAAVDHKKLMSILNKHYLKPSITTLWDAKLSTRDPRILSNELRGIIRTFNIEYRRNISLVDGCITFVNRGNERYDDVCLKLKETGLKRSNSADFEIMLDAHHVGLTKSNDLHFITADWEDIVKRKDAIVACTSLKNIILLKEFSNYCKMRS
ncbi:hypothetical protein MSBRW_1237 [Methanosarcina barkeri str. Wiesmoor]|uniref:DUF4935 domain-containing protein n=2 Tax=Methanosarcina barkeri TaxID=2208 RepID=A0A0E3QK43_METBA|nr:hypothetical protein [Methanosarcina barkeri]AKB50490.1 hypothetical protein MSBRW_1237 [Methanosarcina barkeri str. Wiesmoor]